MSENTSDMPFNLERGEFPLAVPTSLALEGAFGIHPDHPPLNGPEPIRKFNTLWVNVATLYRNVYNSLPSDQRHKVTEVDLKDIIHSEINTVEGIIQDRLKGKVKTIFYINHKDKLDKYYPKAIIRKPTTDKQKQYGALQSATLKDIQKGLDGIDFREFHVRIDGEGKSLMLTHVPIDLISFYDFDNLVLLESHTGVLKQKSQWGSKLAIKDETLPFNKFMLQMFGDGLYFTPQPAKYRKALLDIAKKDKWTPTWSGRRMQQSIGKIKDYEIREFIKEVYKESR